MGNYDAVHKPAHYCEGRIYEPKDVIRNWGLNFNLGSSLKYIARAGRKDDIVQDLEKAKEYLQFEIDAILLERETGSRVSKNCDSLCDTCVRDGGFDECWESGLVLGSEVTDYNGNIIYCPYYKKMAESNEPEVSVMHVEVPKGTPLEDIIKVFISKLYEGE